MDVVNEGSTAYLAVSFLDKNGNVEAPASATFRVDGKAPDATVWTEVLDDADILPILGTVELVLTPTANALITQDDDYEDRLVTIKATYDASDGVNAEYLYKLKNLAKVP